MTHTKTHAKTQTKQRHISLCIYTKTKRGYTFWGQPFPPFELNLAEQTKMPNFTYYISKKLIILNSGIFDIAPREAAELGEQVQF